MTPFTSIIPAATSCQESGDSRDRSRGVGTKLGALRLRESLPLPSEFAKGVPSARLHVYPANRSASKRVTQAMMPTVGTAIIVIHTVPAVHTRPRHISCAVTGTTRHIIDFSAIELGRELLFGRRATCAAILDQ